MNENPWKVKSKTIKYDRLPYLRVVEEKVVRPDGSEGTYTIIKSHHAIHIAPIDDEGNIYLVKEFKHGIDGISIQTIGGYIEEGETPTETAKRELLEEGGIVADLLTDLGFVYTNPSSSDNKIYFFVARGLHFGETQLEGSEVMTLAKYSFDDALKMIYRGEISYNTSCDLIQRASAFLSDKQLFKK